MHTKTVKVPHTLPHILLLYYKMIPSVRLCGHCQMEYLSACQKVAYKAVEMRYLHNDDLNWADLVLIGRLDGYYERKVVQRLYQAGKPVAYIIDDDLLNVPLSISSGVYYAREDKKRNILDMIGSCNAIISPSPILLAKYAVDGRIAIQNEEPAIDPISYHSHSSGKPVKIGFAGSIDRTRDIEELLEAVLLRIHREYADAVEFEFFGAKPSFAEKIGARCIPYCESYEQYRQVLNSLDWDIGLAPLPDTPFHRCKHYNKFSEYAAAGVAGIFSEVEPYLRLRNTYQYEMLCENTSEAWYQSITELIQNSSRREQLRKELVYLAGTDLSIDVCAERLLSDFLPLLSSGNKTSYLFLPLCWYKIAGLFNCVYYRLSNILSKCFCRKKSG